MTTDADDLRSAVTSLTDTITTLRITVGELKTTLDWYIVRDREDRAAAASLDSRVGSLEKWQARIKGQVALAYFLIGLLTALVAARIANLIP